ncbi:hypothetical protein GQ42DRAFT_161157, partial [Ramicandelaber brevisporus]
MTTTPTGGTGADSHSNHPLDDGREHRRAMQEVGEKANGGGDEPRGGGEQMEHAAGKTRMPATPTWRQRTTTTGTEHRANTRQHLGTTREQRQCLKEVEEKMCVFGKCCGGVPKKERKTQAWTGSTRLLEGRLFI